MANIKQESVTKVKKVSLSWIVVSDFEKAKKFFTECVGLRISESNDEYGWAELAGEDGEGLLGISQACEHTPIAAGQNAVVCFTVEDIEEATREYVNKGVKLIGEICEVPGIVKLQLFEDADGNKFHLAQHLNC